MRQLSTSLREGEIERLKSRIVELGGRILPPKNQWEFFRFEVQGYKGVVYTSGKVVYHEPLVSLVEDSLEESPGIEVGSDEAGKGERTGPLVVAAVALDDEGRRFLRARGLLESKSIPPRRLEEIADLVEARALAVSYRVVSPGELRSEWRKGNLNELLARWHLDVISEVLGEVNASRVVVDSFDDRRLKEVLSQLRDLEIIVEPRADLKYASVAAASVVAKRIYVRRVDEGIKWSHSG